MNKPHYPSREDFEEETFQEAVENYYAKLEQYEDYWAEQRELDRAYG